MTVVVLLLAFAAPLTPEAAVGLKEAGEIAAGRNSAALVYQYGNEWFALGSANPLSAIPRGASSLRWSPDGSRLAFFEREALWVLDWQSRNLTRVCDVRQSNAYLAGSGNRLSWSPDGQWLAFAGTLEPAPPPQDPVVITRILYKSRTSLSDNRRTHIYVVAATGGAPRQLTPEGRDQYSLDWGAGEEIVYLANPEKDPDALHNLDIFAVSPATGAIRQITRTHGVETSPRISPDGKQIAYTATTRPITTIDSVAEDTHVWVIPMGGGWAREINPRLDRRCFAPQWDGDAVLYIAQDHGKSVLFRNAERLIDREGAVAGPVRHGEKLYFLFSDSKHPRELWTGDGAVAPASSSWGLSMPELVRYRSFDGAEIEGLFYPPLTATGRWPLILSIHGGPHGMSGYAFNPTAQAFAARGYAMLYLNPRGSSGNGQKFSDGCVNNWGGGDYRDLMAGVDAILKKHSQIDPARLGVMGGSYGGFMTNWVVTQTPRFKAAVSIASVSDMISFYATSMYQDLVHAEFNGFPWEGTNYATLWRWSPLKYVKNVKTPVLFLHGERDNDVHITQAEEMYTALRRRGVEAVLVRYPREGHGFREPAHRLDALKRELDWFDRKLR